MSFERGESHPIIRAAALSLVATAALHTYIELETTHAHGFRVEVGTLNPWAHQSTHTLDLGTVDHGDPYIQTNPVHTEVSGEATTEHEHREMFVHGEYSRQFSLDPNAGKFDEQTLQQTAKTITTLEQEGWNVSVLVQGQASAEDQNDADNDGLQTPSGHNVNLASHRGRVATDALVAEGVDQRNITQKEGHEDSWSDEQMTVLEGLREQFGYSTVLDMIEAHHLKPETVPEQVTEVLTNWIDNKQGTVIIIDASRQIPGKGTHKTTTERVCFVPVLKVQKVITNTDPNKATIPYGLLLMLGIPSLTGLGLAGADWSRRERAHRQYNRELAARRSAASMTLGEVLGNGGGGAGGNSGPEAEPEAEPVPIEETPEPEAVDPETVEPVEEETIIDPPKETEKAKKHRRLWPLILPPIVALGTVLALKSCDPDPKPVAPTPITIPADPCEGLPPQETVVGTKTITVKDGYTRPPVVTIRK